MDTHASHWNCSCASHASSQLKSPWLQFSLRTCSFSLAHFPETLPASSISHVFFAHSQYPDCPASTPPLHSIVFSIFPLGSQLAVWWKPLHFTLVFVSLPPAPGGQSSAAYCAPPSSSVHSMSLPSASTQPASAPLDKSSVDPMTDFKISDRILATIVRTLLRYVVIAEYLL